MAKLLVLHGPNLNLLGRYESKNYGAASLERINRRMATIAQEAGHTLRAIQCNAEHELIAHIHEAPSQEIDVIVFNPSAYTHTSIALRDALLMINIPFVEVHLTNIKAREPFRQHSYFSDIALGVIYGFGPASYELAIRAVNCYLSETH